MSWAADNRGWRGRARARWTPIRAEALRLRAWLDAPVACDGYDPITVEGMLQSTVILRETGRTPDDVFHGCPRDLPLADTDIQIPIVDTEVDGVPIAHASIGWFSPDARPTKRQSWKRADAELYAARTIKVAEAAAKTQMVLKQTVTAAHLDFFVDGCRELLEDLLRDASVIGAGRGGGLGLVQGWEVEPAPASWWFRSDGALMRVLPATTARARGATGYDERPANLRAPYWHPRTRCVVAAVPVQWSGDGYGQA